MSAKDLVQIIDDDDALRDSLTFLLSSAGIAGEELQISGRLSQ